MKKSNIIIPIVFFVLLIFVGLIYFNENGITKNIEDDQVSTTEVNLEKVQESNLLKEYKENTHNFNKLSAKEVEEKIESNESFFLYFGRGTCPYCRDFVPKLAKESEEKNINISYLDTENTDSDKDIQNIRNKYDVEFVPTLIHFSDFGNSVKVFNSETETLGEFFEDVLAKQ